MAVFSGDLVTQAGMLVVVSAEVVSQETLTCRNAGDQVSDLR
jgi:hypothetical protein